MNKEYAIHYPDGKVEYFDDYSSAEKELKRWKNAVLMKVVVVKVGNNFVKNINLDI